MIAMIRWVWEAWPAFPGVPYLPNLYWMQIRKGYAYAMQLEGFPRAQVWFPEDSRKLAICISWALDEAEPQVLDPLA